MPYAANNKISNAPIDGGIEITDAQYREALDGMAQGKVVSIANGFEVKDKPQPVDYWLSADDKRKTEPGEEPPDGAALTPPPSRYHSVSNGEWILTSEAEARQWHDRIAATRYDHETKGTTFTHSDGSVYAIATDSISQGKAAGKALRAWREQQAGNTGWTCQWKTAQGFVVCSPDDTIKLAEAVDDHVQTCFDRESELLAKVEDGSITEDDLETGWP